ncbi:MAG TPA: hypothetical protein VM142_01775 [Acidimicrobiales bacterium]|nr:hypothetical protein [Acidimicrobiales bacterium]
MARATRVPALVRGVRWVTLPPLRRMIDGVLATTIIVNSTFGGGRMAVAEPVRVGPVVVQLDEQSEPPPAVANKPVYQPRPAGNGSARGNPVARPPITEKPPASASTTTRRPEEPSPPAPSTAPGRDAALTTPSTAYVVRPGDNFWNIAQRQLAKTTDRPSNAPSVKEVAGYWVQLVETNRHTIRSGNPNLIYPGEAIGLPICPRTCE